MGLGSSQKKISLTGFVLHLHPRTIPPETLRFSLSFGLGGMAAVLLGLLVLTGILQLLSYAPQIDEAYLSVQQMYAKGNLAGFIRNVHFWSGNLLVIISSLHLLRIFATGALTGGRQYNWLIGIALYLLVLFANFTGYLMPWDQLAYWAVTIFIGMISYVPVVGGWLVEVLRGGAEVGQPTLANFFAIHLGVVPVLLVILLIFHFWLVRKSGGLVQKKNTMQKNVGREKRIDTVPYLIQREVCTGLVLLGLVLLFSAFVDAPLAEQANPGESPNPAKAAWYFMGMQELLLHLPPLFAICIVPMLMTLGLAIVPLLEKNILPAGYWFGGSRGVFRAIFSFLGGFLVTLLFVILDERIQRTTHGNNLESSLLTQGLLPLLTYLVGLTLVYAFFTRIQKHSRPDAIAALFMINVGLICALTTVGIWFRGPSMTLIGF